MNDLALRLISLALIAVVVATVMALLSVTGDLWQHETLDTITRGVQAGIR